MSSPNNSNATNCLEAFTNDILICTASYLNPKDLVNLGLTCRRFGSSNTNDVLDSSGNDRSLVEEAAKQMIEVTTTEMERVAVYPFFESWIERWYLLENRGKSSVTIQINFCGTVTSITMKKWQKMVKPLKAYCDCKRGGVHELRFLLDGERLCDETPISLELDADRDIIYCFLPQPLPDDEFLAKVGASHLIGTQGEHHI